MSTTFSIDRRISLCTFTFSDGRRCRTPRSPQHPTLCTYHARKEAQAHATQKLGQDIARDFSGRYTSACDLTSALRHLFTAVAQGIVKPRAANTLAYLAQTMVQSIAAAEHEYIDTFGEQTWHEAIADNLYPGQWRSRGQASAAAKSPNAATAEAPADSDREANKPRR